VTVGGRITAMFIMIAGIGIIGVLASLMSSMLVGSSAAVEEEKPEAEIAGNYEQDLAMIKNELAELRQMMEKMSVEGDK
jgi:demethoxyubiquinone hydroxylase (CLK1/Coq7/Cat5 family)